MPLTTVEASYILNELRNMSLGLVLPFEARVFILETLDEAADCIFHNEMFMCAFHLDNAALAIKKHIN